MNTTTTIVTVATEPLAVRELSAWVWARPFGAAWKDHAFTERDDILGLRFSACGRYVHIGELSGNPARPCQACLLAMSAK